MSSNQNSIPYQILIRIIEFLLFCSSFAHAEIRPQDLKGAHDLINPRYEYLSPVYAFTWLETKALENMRFYGNFGPKKEGYGCLERATRIHQLLIKNQDCPQDRISELLQRFFPSQDGVTFVENQLRFDPVFYLEPEVIGALLNRMAHVSDSDLENQSKIKDLETDFRNILNKALNPRNYYTQLQKLKMDRMQLLKKQLYLQNKEPMDSSMDQNDPKAMELRSEVEALTSEIRSIKTNLKTINSTSKTGIGNESEFEEIGKLITAAIQEARNSPYAFQRYLPEQILLAYFWKKGNTKQDLIRLFEGMESDAYTLATGNRSQTEESVLKSSSVLKDSEWKKQFAESQFSNSDIDPELTKGDPKHQARHFLAHPDQLAFYVYQSNQEQRNHPPLIPYGLTQHSSLNGRPFVDCGETSLRNFFNIVLFDRNRKKFDIHLLTQMKDRNPGLSFHPNLISFYEHHSDLASALTPEIRDEWTEKVVSEHEGVNYKRPNDTPKCELSSSKGGIDNMMALLDRLLFDHPKKEKSVLKNSDGGFSTIQDRAGKLDLLCKLISRDGFQLSWRLINEQGRYLDKHKVNDSYFGNIEFIVNDIPSFVWHFADRHFSLQTFYHQDPDTLPIEEAWRTSVATQISKAFVSGFNSRETSSFLLLHWLATELSFDFLESNQSGLVFSLPISTTDGKMSAFKKIIENRMEFFYPVAKRIQLRLPLDQITQRTVSMLLLDFDYPLGDPPHALGMPEIQYTRISQHQKDLLVARHGDLFKDAWIGPKRWIESKNEDGTVVARSEQLIWSEVIRETSSKSSIIIQKRMTQEEAATACSAFGARLPSREEFEAFSKDLGKESSIRFTPQFLKMRFPRFYWALSRTGKNNAFFFNGNNGEIISDNRDRPYSAFCVLEVTPCDTGNASCETIYETAH